jgi:hypothetical protein
MTPAAQLEVVGGSDPLLTNAWSSFDKLTDVMAYPMLAFHERTLGLPLAAIVQRTIEIDADPSSTVPTGFEQLITVDNASGGALLATCGSCSMMLRWKTDHEVLAIISAETASEAQHWMQALAAQHPMIRETCRPEVRTWRVTDYGSPMSTLGRIDACPWSETARNYPGGTGAELGALIGSEPRSSGGPRLILWFGAPGTGKTSAIRTLAREWSGWCDVHVMAEPEALLSRPSYLAAAIDHRPDGADRTRSGRQRLIVAEDCDVLLAAPQSQVGPALARLLNVTDGLSAGAAEAFVLITTNQPVHRFHPALVRPGRCLALIEFAPFDEQEANRWLPDDAPKVRGRQTLAELYEHTRQDGEIGAQRCEQLEGGYL